MTDPRTVLITGCSSGMGRHAALHLHRAGYRVYATARRPQTLADDGLTILPLDVTDEASMTAAVDHIEDAHGAVSILINNAGYGLHGPVEEVTADDLRSQFPLPDAPAHPTA